MLNYDKDGYEITIFESVAEMIDTLHPLDIGTKDVRLDEYFVGRSFSNFADVEKAATSAWDHGISVVEKMLADLEDSVIAKPKSRRRRTRFSQDDGDELDYDRLRSGQDYWRTSRRQNVTGPGSITVLVNVSANAGTDHEDILWRGAAAIALTKMLEEAGYRVELWCMENSVRSFTDGTHNLCAVNLKRTSDPLDVSTLVSAVSGWFFRTMFFKDLYKGKRTVEYGKGRAQPLKADQADEISRDVKRVIIDDVFSYDAAVTVVKAKLIEMKLV